VKRVPYALRSWTRGPIVIIPPASAKISRGAPWCEITANLGLHFTIEKAIKQCHEESLKKKEELEEFFLIFGREVFDKGILGWITLPHFESERVLSTTAKAIKLYKSSYSTCLYHSFSASCRGSFRKISEFISQVLSWLTIKLWSIRSNELITLYIL